MHKLICNHHNQQHPSEITNILGRINNFGGHISYVSSLVIQLTCQWTEMMRISKKLLMILSFITNNL